MSSVIRLFLLTAIAWCGCLAIASTARIATCQDDDTPWRRNLRQARSNHEFVAVKEVTNAAVETLFKDENESGQVPTADWKRLQAYLRSFQSKHPDFRSERLDDFIRLADSKAP